MKAKEALGVGGGGGMLDRQQIAPFTIGKEIKVTDSSFPPASCLLQWIEGKAFC